MRVVLGGGAAACRANLWRPLVYLCGRSEASVPHTVRRTQCAAVRWPLWQCAGRWRAAANLAWPTTRRQNHAKLHCRASWASYIPECPQAQSLPLSALCFPSTPKRTAMAHSLPNQNRSFHPHQAARSQHKTRPFHEEAAVSFQPPTLDAGSRFLSRFSHCPALCLCLWPSPCPCLFLFLFLIQWVCARKGTLQSGPPRAAVC